jgi:hypothetical protein
LNRGTPRSRRQPERGKYTNDNEPNMSKLAGRQGWTFAPVRD